MLLPLLNLLRMFSVELAGDVVEPVSAAESSSAVLTAESALTESITATDVQAAIELDEAAISESASAGAIEGVAVDFVSAISEAQSISEVATSTADFFSDVSEPLAALDEQSGTVEAQTFEVEAVESVDASDSSTATVAEVPALLPPIINGGTWPTRPLPLPLRWVHVERVRIGEHVAVADTITAQRTLNSSLRESIAVRDGHNAQLQSVATISDRLNATDSTDAQLIVGRRLLEVLQFAGAVLHVYDDLSISVITERGTSVDVTVSRGDHVGVVELPLESYVHT